MNQLPAGYEERIGAEMDWDREPIVVDAATIHLRLRCRD